MMGSGMNKPCFGKFSRMLILGIATALTINPMNVVQAQSACIRQSLANHDYCGAEGRKLLGNVPDRMIGDFKGACAGHDACYSLGAERVVNAMENRYRQSMLGADSAQKAEFRQEMSRIKRSCDRSFLSDMQRACSRVTLLDKPKCQAAAAVYHVGVDRLAGKAFEQALDSAFTCRTR